MSRPAPDDGYEDPLTNKQIDEALQPFTTRRERRRIVRVLEQAKLAVFPDN